MSDSLPRFIPPHLPLSLSISVYLLLSYASFSLTMTLPGSPLDRPPPTSFQSLSDWHKMFGRVSIFLPSLSWPAVPVATVRGKAKMTNELPDFLKEHKKDLSRTVN